MAEFMAAILDHSNLRPKGVNVQVTPTRGNDDFEITMMISVRDDSFAPVEDQVVDWFYTDDSEDKGLLSNGECALIKILSSGDCEWEEDRDDETNRDGNIFEDRIRATPGETMTFYAWIGSQDGDEFDEDDFNGMVRTSRRRRRSPKRGRAAFWWNMTFLLTPRRSTVTVHTLLTWTATLQSSSLSNSKMKRGAFWSRKEWRYR